MPRILVADDNTNIQKMVSLAFEERGIDVVSVGNGEAAVRRIPDLNPDLVLADVFMPVRNGYEVCEFVKKDDRFSHVPVILLVGAFDPLDEKEARRVGADGVLKKPFVPPDPLIAMVTSALEKNPKVAAEMAKAREAAAAPPAPEPVAPVLEAPARMEPKPLPEFPEPTAEEAAQIYGFGKGVRSADDEEVPADDEREAPKSLKAPKATGKKHQAEEDDEDDADAMTAHDWRRSAGDFEVPDEPGGRLAFNPDTDFSPITFPSEREVPPKRIPADDFEESETAVASQSPSEVADIEPIVETKPVAREESSVEAVAESKTIAFPGPPDVSPLSAKEPEPVVAAQSDTTTATPESPAPPASNENLPAPEPQSTQAPKSKIGAWMDMMASPSEYSEGGWLSSIFGHRSENKPTPKQKHETDAGDRSAEHGVAESTPQPSSRIDAIDHVHQREEEQKEESQFEAVRSLAREPLPAENSLELSAPELKAASPAFVPPDSPGPDAPEPETWFSPPPPPILRDASESKPVLALTTISQTDREFIAPPPDDSGSRRDPYLEEPASAARVVPEPLLIRDDAEPNEVSRFSRAAEQPSPLHSFFAPASGGPITEDSVGHDDPAHHEEFKAPIFAAPEETESPSAGATERIPTGPPPNREALADIPFLMPPPPSPFERASENQTKDSAQVDAVVAKVLEKLEPQLHQLLSQSLLRPLVENLLNQELQKKEK